jgi:hypothetical protein
MAAIRQPIPVKLFVGMISSEPSLFDECAELLSTEFGPLDLRAPIVVWDKTEYYRQEMGTDLLRTFVFFERLLDPEQLATIKHMTNLIEKRLSHTASNNRRINLDPGYITEAKVVLASTKDFSHRVYIGRHIYAEVTLQFREQGKTFVALEHTYPDFRRNDLIEIFNGARELLRAALKKKVRAR